MSFLQKNIYIYEEIYIHHTYYTYPMSDIPKINWQFQQVILRGILNNAKTSVCRVIKCCPLMFAGV